jgi:F420-dependent oxidoreductase-like protein
VRIGILFGGSRSEIVLDELVRDTRDVEQRGFSTVWVPNVFGHDAITSAAILGRETREIEIGTAVVPTQPRHPVAMAQQALTAGAACDGRFTLGIGLSHPAVIEFMFGLSYARKAKHMREYLAVLGPLLRGEAVDFEGEEFRVRCALGVPGAGQVPLVIAALGSQMLGLAGHETDGTILWMAGVRTIESHIVPRVRAAAREAGRPAPRVIAGMHICLTSKPDEVKARLAKALSMYGQMPSYRAMLDIEGTEQPENLALIGDEAALDEAMARLRDIGVTDFEASIFARDAEDEARTLDYLEGVAKRAAA